MAITHFGSVSVPTDNGAQDDFSTVSITPPTSMVSGQLVFVRVTVRNATEGVSQVHAGGQTWTEGTLRQGASQTSRSYYCIFNGTWSANPSWASDFQLGAAFTIFMSVFSPTAGSEFFLDVADTYNFASAPTTPFDITIAGQTPTSSASVVTIADWSCQSDARTWALQTGGWTNAIGTQIRSTTGSGMSMSRAYLIQTSASATGDVTNRQDSTGNATQRNIITFREAVISDGYTYVTANVDSTETAASIVFGASPAVVDGNQFRYMPLTDQGIAFEIDVQGYVTVAPSTGRQTFNVQLDTGGGFGSDVAFSVGNSAPVEARAIASRTLFINVPMTDIRLEGDYVTEADGDLCTPTVDVALPTGLSFSSSLGYNRITGTPTGSPGATSHVVTLTDQWGGVLNMTSFTLTLVAGATWPDVVGDTVADATTAIEAAGLLVEFYGRVNNGIVARGLVDSQDRIAGTVAELGSAGGIYIEGDLAPDVVGTQLTSATAAFEALDATVIDVAVYGSGYPLGQVSYQSIAANSVVIPGDEVQLEYAAESADDQLQDLLDPGENNLGVLIVKKMNTSDPTKVSYYCVPIQVSRGRSRWVDVDATATVAAQAASILAQLEIPTQPGWPLETP